nr:DUF4070 domain-containing protein [Methylomarinum sp. Ch1-1]MDP4520931.1 DUF4070 domain-containing protein [Methylomarinum sp. Ch1-1]
MINFIPLNFSIEQAERNYLKILQAIYHPDAYFKRVMRHLQRVDPLLKGDFRDRREQLSAVIKILSRQNALNYWRYLFQALKIAGRRFPAGSAAYTALTAEYFALCAQYTHFIGQTRALQRQIEHRRYQGWQRCSWRQVLAAEIEAVELLQAHPDTPLLDTIRLDLALDHCLTGTRLQLMEYYCEPLIWQAFADGADAMPSDRQFVALQIEAFAAVYRQRTAIAGGIAWEEIERHLQATLAQNHDFVLQMRRRFRKFLALKALSDEC